MTNPSPPVAPRQTTKVIQVVAAAHANPHAWWRWPLGAFFIAWSIYERHAHPAGVPVDARDFWVFHFGLLAVGVAVLPGVGELLLAFAKGGIGLWQTFKSGKPS